MTSLMNFLPSSKFAERNQRDARRDQGRIASTTGGAMLTEPAPNAAPDVPVDPLDVVVLVVPENASPTRVIDVIAQASTSDHTAVLVVLPLGTDPQLRRGIMAAGANHCAIAPPSDELFAHMERARADARHRRNDDTARDDPLDVFWRSRSARR